MDKLIKLRNCEHKCYPLTDYEEIINFEPSDLEQNLIDEFCIGIRPNEYILPGPKTLVCHDYKGGYLNDAYIKGSDESNEFRFYHWHLIDTFIYFSHHLITIPPLPFINAAHKNGVQILGTFITEHSNGKIVLESILSDNYKINQFSIALANLMKIFNFDGWLLNIENKIESNLIVKLVNLVKLINDECKKVDENSKVIWYDAVTKDGNLNWQNELNINNKLFFDNCDGIFLNYNWSNSHLLNSAEMANQRKHDVYVGIDVFGRGCIGGWNCKEAIDKIKDYDLSIAIFAPGWIHEENDINQFNENNKKFWNLLDLPLRHLPTQLPLESFCCQGFGNKFFEFGECVEEREWTNNLMQEIQLNCNHLELDCLDSFIGGNCLLLNKFNKPILNLRFNWIRDLFIILIYKYNNDNIIISASTNLNTIEIAKEINDLSDFNASINQQFFNRANYLKENLNNNWNILLAYFKRPSSNNKIIEKIYLQSNSNHNTKLKIGYFGLF